MSSTAISWIQQHSKQRLQRIDPIFPNTFVASDWPVDMANEKTGSFIKFFAPHPNQGCGGKGRRPPTGTAGLKKMLPLPLHWGVLFASCGQAQAYAKTLDVCTHAQQHVARNQRPAESLTRPTTTVGRWEAYSRSGLVIVPE